MVHGLQLPHRSPSERLEDEATTMKRRFFALCVLMMAIALSGCAAFNYSAPDSPVAQSTAHFVEPRPRVALVLGSGGPLTLFDLSVFADRGWIHGQRLQDYVNDRLNNASLEQLPRRLIVATTRRADKQPAFFERGNVGVAVRASSAVAGCSHALKESLRKPHRPALPGSRSSSSKLSSRVTMPGWHRAPLIASGARGESSA
jgi:hypothetical protein